MSALTTLTSGVVAALLAQQSGQAVYAIPNPQQWVLEYPTIIAPFVEDYYNCLRNGSYEIGGGQTFASQYEKDIPRCEAQGSAKQAEANAVVARYNRQNDLPPDQVATIFASYRSLHLARGQDIDSQLQVRLATSTDKPEAGEDPACIERVRNLIVNRQTFAQENSDRIEAIHTKADYSDEDRQAMFAYTRELSRFTSLISLEAQTCPSALHLAAGD